MKVQKTAKSTHTVRLTREALTDAETVKKAFGLSALTQAIITALRLTAQEIKNK